MRRPPRSLSGDVLALSDTWVHLTLSVRGTSACAATDACAAAAGFSAGGAASTCPTGCAYTPGSMRLYSDGVEQAGASLGFPRGNNAGGALWTLNTLRCSGY